MKFLSLPILGLALILLASCTASQPVPVDTPMPPTPTPEAPFRIIGYVPEWIAVADLLPFDKLTHINYAFLIPKADGSLQPLLNPWKLKAIVEKAHAHGTKVLVSVGGWGWDKEFEQLAASAETRLRFVEALDQFAQAYELDGIDIDWEYPGPEQASSENFVTLMGELEARLQPQGKLLTSAVVAYGSNGDAILSAVFDLVDFLNIMAYDGPDLNHSSYEYAVQALDYWSARGLPVEKTVLGVPFYARPSEATYRQLVGDNPEAANVDEIKYLGTTVYYNGIPTMQRKTELAMERASGIMIWEISQDTTDATSLVNAIYQTAYGDR
jgi:chitinase